MTKQLLSFLFLLISAIANAQSLEPQMADTFRQEGKIYVVITVIAMIFVALVVFLVILERKLKSFENKIKN
ncbi:MAG: CcmD family protein [Bacteroidetes bacterium]|nr:CcmD family protein [Bacteroidota bacterium]